MKVNIYLLLLLFLFLLLAPMPCCPGCKTNFKSLASHTLSCTELLNALGRGPELKHKHQEAQQLEKIKQQKVEEAQLTEERAQE